MKLSKSYFYTLRENAKDEDSISGNLLVRSGMIKKVAAGIYIQICNKSYAFLIKNGICVFLVICLKI